MRYLDRMQPLALLALRVVLGAIMIAHGYHKVFGGMAHHMESVKHIGFPGWVGYLSAGTEFFGGMLLIAGLLTRITAFAVAFEMAVAVLRVHWKNGLTGEGGYEFPLALATVAFALIFFGAGPIAMDAIAHGRSGRLGSKKS